MGLRATAMSAPPLVSVAMAAYNAGPVLTATLESVLAQTYPRLEVIVVDDGSTDGTAGILAGYRGRVTVIRQENGGIAKARNTGMARAQGELVAWMDQDDLCRPERIALQVAALRMHPEALLCSSDFTAFDAVGPVSASYGAAYYSAIGQEPGQLGSLYPHEETVRMAADPALGVAREESLRIHHGMAYPKLAFGNFVHPPTVMFRRRAAAAIGGLDEGLRYTCDWEWLVRLARSGPFLHIARPLLDYRLSDTQITSPVNKGSRGALDVLRTATRMAAADPGLVTREPVRFHAAMRDHRFDVAYRLSETAKLAAASHWLQGVRHGGLSGRALRLGLRILTPAAVFTLVRRARARAAPPPR